MSDPHSSPSSGKPPSEEQLKKVTPALLREQAEPYEENNPIPLPLIVAFFLLFAWGGFYLATYSAGWRVDVYNPKWTPGGGEAKAEVAFNPLQRGERLFAINCQLCHQSNGQGVAGAFPPLAGSRWVLDDDGTRMAKILMRGMQGPIEVKGVAYDGSMPSYGENGLNWSNRDIAAVVTWVRQAWDNSAEPISEEQVAEIRESIAGKSNTWHSSEILADHPLK